MQYRKKPVVIEAFQKHSVLSTVSGLILRSQKKLFKWCQSRPYPGCPFLEETRCVKALTV